MAEIRTIAVIGAGVPGRVIALAFALGGYRTILEDILPSSLRNAESEIRAQLSRFSALGRVPVEQAEAAFQRLEYASTVAEAAREADLVIESVPDELESKIEIFTLLDKICKPDTILASNTSSLSVTEIASVTYRAKKILGMRFALPPHETDILTLVRARETNDETIAACTLAGRRMGKQVVLLEEHASQST
ncbi:MAG TPA: 3-hydroxyacyl-CoA dehydrogenase NAD-binding domain-containing protein [Candidatus Angelobacter sp.]